jgi:CO/xanthine dehydrogenase FAD-binding subunit
MILNSFGYKVPVSLAEALTMLRQPGAGLFTGDQAFVGGVQKKGASPGKNIVSLRKIEGLGSVTRSEAGLDVGIGVSFSTLLSAGTSFSVLIDALKTVKDPHLRNHSNIGGALYHRSSTHGPVLASLLALDASCVTTEGARTEVPLATYLAENLDEKQSFGELFTAVSIPDSEGRNGAFQCVDYLKSGQIACGAAVTYEEADGILRNVRVAISGCVAVPVRLYALEAGLEGKTRTAEAVQHALALSAADMPEISSSFVDNVSYLRHLTRVMIRRAILKNH